MILRNPPEPTGGVDRAAKIAALHAFADWLTETPAAPIPTVVLATYHVTDADELDEATRVAGVLSVMRELGIRPTEGERTVQGDLDLCTKPIHGVSVVYRAAAHKDDRPKRIYT